MQPQRFISGRKGNIDDTIANASYILVIAIVSVIAVVAFTNVNTQWQAAANIPTESKEYMDTVNDNVKMSDFIVPLIYFFFTIFTMFLNARIGTNTTFTILYIFLMIVVVIVSIAINNVWYEMTLNTTLAASIADLPLTNWMMEHIVLLSLFFATLTGIALFSNVSNQDRGVI